MKDMMLMIMVGMQAVQIIANVMSPDPTCDCYLQSTGYTSLHFTTQAGHTEARQLLLSDGADPNATLTVMVQDSQCST